jgi:hypothetical protein
MCLRSISLMHNLFYVERKFGQLISRPHIAPCMHDACAHCVQCRPQRICVNSSSCVVARAGLSALVSHRIRMARAFQFEISVCRARVSDSGSAFVPNMRAGGHCGVWSFLRSSNIFPWTSCIYRVILFVWYTVLLWSDHDYLFLLTMFPFRFYLRQLLCGTCFPRSYFDIFFACI